MTFRDRAAAEFFLRGFVLDRGNMTILRHILAGEVGPRGIADADDDEIIAQLARRLATGELKIARTPIAPASLGLMGDEEEEAVVLTREKTWIAVKLVGEDGEGVSGISYEVTDTKGKVHRGRTDMQGVGHVAGLDPGSCKVRFPELDKDAWEAA